MLNDKELTLKDNVKFEIDQKTSSNNLVIPKLSPVAHSGKYTIKASNVVGEAEHKFEVEILGKKSDNHFFFKFIVKMMDIY